MVLPLNQCWLGGCVVGLKRDCGGLASFAPLPLVVLNSTSSAGKTTIAQTLASRLGPGCVLTSLVEILERMQPLGRAASAGRGLRVLWFQLSDGRLRLFRQLHREVAAHARGGRDVIVESALMDRRALWDAAACFAPLGGLLVSVKPPLAVSEQWEAGRADRPVGQARKHYALIHSHGHYDLLLDPSMQLPAECASAILRRLAHAAALIDRGPEVLGFDNDQSTDHHSGPRALLFLSETDHRQLGSAIQVARARWKKRC